MGDEVSTNRMKPDVRLFQLAAGLGALILAWLFVTRWPRGRPLPGEHFFPLRGRWLLRALPPALFLTSVWLLGICFVANLFILAGTALARTMHEAPDGAAQC